MALARVRRHCEVTWAGRDGEPETRRMVPDVAFLMDLEARGVSLIGLVNDMKSGRLNLGQVSYLVASVLARAGWKRVTPDDVFDQISDDAGSERVMAVLTAVMEAVFPPPPGDQAEKPGPSA